MAVRKIIPWVAIALVAVAVITTVRTCRPGPPDPTYWVKRADYDRAVAAREDAIEGAVAAIAGKQTEIDAALASAAGHVQTIAALQADLVGATSDGAALAAENERLRTDLEAVIAANPKLQELIKSFDLRIANYESRLSLVTRQLGESEAAREDQGVAIVALTFQRDHYKDLFEQEARLRITSDMLRLECEKSWHGSAFWATVGKWGPPVTFVAGFLFGRR